MTEPVTLLITIENTKGLHARAAAKFVKTVEQFDADVEVMRIVSGHTSEAEEFDGPISGTSLLGLMMLAAEKGTALKITASGKDSEAVLAALTQLVGEKFGEE